MRSTPDIPEYWRNRLEDIDTMVSTVSKGHVNLLGHSAGGRNIYAVSYGAKDDFSRTANYNSACGAADLSFYAKKSNHTKPVLLIVAGVHGGELEGITAVLNLIRMLETGCDFRGETNAHILQRLERFRLVLIPCMNPDGRARIPYRTLAGMPLAEMRYHLQGTWKDGSLCDWPACKAVHPIIGHVGHLGSYFNDEGINIMHDQFFAPMANETKMLMELVDSEAADATVQLHGGANAANHILSAHYVPAYIRELQNDFNRAYYNELAAKGLTYLPAFGEHAESSPPPSFNLSSAIHHISGGLSMVYESNMGLDAPGERYTYEQMMDSHYILFEQLLRYMEQNYPIADHMARTRTAADAPRA